MPVAGVAAADTYCHDGYSGTVSVVTGGASGIGATIVRELVGRSGLVVGDVNDEHLQALREQLGSAVTPCQCDVRVENDVEGLVQQAIRQHGRLTHGFNVAGLGRPAPLEDMTLKQWDETVDVCLRGAFLSVKHEGRQMLAQGVGGAIVNIASLMAGAPSRGAAAYSSAKAGVIMLTKTAALEWGDRGIRVNAVSPGLTDTPAVAALLADPQATARFLDRIPLRRVGSAGEIASAALFLGGDQSGYTSGAHLVIDGAFATTGYPYTATPQSTAG